MTILGWLICSKIKMRFRTKPKGSTVSNNITQFHESANFNHTWLKIGSLWLSLIRNRILFHWNKFNTAITDSSVFLVVNFTTMLLPNARSGVPIGKLLPEKKVLIFRTFPEYTRMVHYYYRKEEEYRVILNRNHLDLDVEHPIIISNI